MKKKVSKKGILVIGSMNVDMVVGVDRIPNPGETLLGGKFEKHAGGKGANQAVAACKLWKNTSFCAGAGEDSLGNDYLKYLKKTGLKLGLVKKFADKPTGVALIMVASNGENIIAVAPGANMALKPVDVKSVDFSKFSHLVLQLETPLATVGEAITRAKKAGCEVILTPAPAQKLPKSWLKNIDILVPNEHEILLVQDFESKDYLVAAKGLVERGVKNVIVTLGSKGCVLVNSEGIKKYDSFKVKALDTVGAGDCFTGALAAGLCKFGGDIDSSIVFASMAAAFAVTKSGAQSSPTEKELEKFASKNKKVLPRKKC